MNLPDYLNEVAQQIRCERARKLVTDELQVHIECQKAAYMEEGMNEQEAMEEAVRQMGDPIDVGTSLNRIHRPKLDIRLLIIVGVITLMTLLTRFLICQTSEMYTISAFWSQCIYSMIGIGIMMGVYYLDYTFIGAYPLLLWGGYQILGLLISQFGHRAFSGTVLIYPWSLAAIPLFAGVLFFFRNKGIIGIFLAWCLSLLPVYLCIRSNCLSNAFICMTMLFIMLNIAAFKQWFLPSRKKALASLWAIGAGVPAIFILICKVCHIQLLSNYMYTRMNALFIDSNSASDIFYQSNHVIKVLKESTLFGNGATTCGDIPGYENDFVITFIFNYCGIIIGCLIVSLMLYFIYRMAVTVRKQKNYLGFMIGCGCMLSLSLQIVVYLVTNTILPQISIVWSQQYLPFLSSGGANTIYSYLMVGLILSIHRNSELVSNNAAPKKLTLRLNNK